MNINLGYEDVLIPFPIAITDIACSIATCKVLQKSSLCLLLKYVPYCFWFIEDFSSQVLGPSLRPSGGTGGELHQSGLCYHVSCRPTRHNNSFTLLYTHIHTFLFSQEFSLFVVFTPCLLTLQLLNL